MAWQNEDADANRQGLTISEFGEIDGPGMGGCPAGATGQGPKSPTGVTAAQDGTNIAVTWTPAEQNPGTSPVLGYSVRAVSKATTDGAQSEFGRRIFDPAAASASLPGTLDGNRIEVRTITEAGESWPPALDGAAAGGGSSDTTAPSVTAAPAGTNFTGPAQITLSSDSADAQIYYTLDGSSPLEGPDGINPAATLYEAPFTVEKPATGSSVTLKYVAIDAANNTSQVKTETYTLTATPVSGATPLPAVVTANPGPNATSATLTLVNGVTYDVTILATNAVGDGPASAAKQVTPAAPAADTVRATSASWKSNDFRVRGTGSVDGSTVTVWRVDAQGNRTTQIGTLTATVTIGAFDWRLRTGVPTTNPGRVVVVSSGGGVSAPITVANG
ncbi:FN3 associated domain-containing protein [Geodermatophilus sp. URMC 64]